MCYLNKSTHVGIIRINTGSYNFTAANITNSSGNRIYPKTTYDNLCTYYPGSGTNLVGILHAKSDGTVTLSDIGSVSINKTYVMGEVVFFY